MANAASSAASSASASVTRARQSMEQRNKQGQVASGMFRLAIAISISTIISLLVCSAVFYGLNNLHESGAYVFQTRNTFWGLVGASFVLTFFGTFVPMLKKVDFGPPAQRVAAQSIRTGSSGTHSTGPTNSGRTSSRHVGAG